MEDGKFFLLTISGEASPTFGHANANYRAYKESISKEMNNIMIEICIKTFFQGSNVVVAANSQGTIKVCATFAAFV
jgi:hypothetical protein